MTPTTFRFDVEKVVGAAVAGLHDDLTAGHAFAGEQVQVLHVLHRPPGIGNLAVDEHTCALLGRQLRVPITGIHCSQP
jgi:hypothetical protein